ncbi:MAG: 3TM-type holin [Polaromonas sp.]
MNAILATILGIIGKVIPDPEQRAKAQLDILKMHQDGDLADLNAVVQVMAAEMNGNWLQRSWRPILMLTFGGLIVARWFGFSAPNLAPDEYLELWGIVKLAMGGYVIGRSLEKTAPAVVQAMQGAKS